MLAAASAGGALASAGPWAYVLLFAVAAGESSAFLGLVVPGETFVLAAGALAARGHLAVGWLMLAVIAGGVVGDSIGYGAGQHFGGCRDHGLLARVWSCRRMTRVRAFLDRHGAPTIFLARFVGFLRPLAPFAAGAVRMPYRRFLVYNVAGAIVWATATLAAGYFLGTAVAGRCAPSGCGSASSAWPPPWSCWPWPAASVAPAASAGLRRVARAQQRRGAAMGDSGRRREAIRSGGRP